MTVVADSPIAENPAGPWPRRLWGTPLRVHLAVLGLVLVGLMAVVGTSASFSADEGAAITQARSLARGDGWIVPHPVPAVDPDGVHYPLEFSAKGPDGVAPFAKHPLYALVLAGAERLGGINAMVALSVLGTLAAAAVAAALATRMGGAGLARPALWGVGLGTPLLLDGYLVIAHTLGAALAGATVLVAAVAIDRRKPGLAALAVAPLAALAVLFRAEALLLAAALALVAGALALRRRGSERWTPALVGAASLAGAGLAMVAEKAWASAIVGGTALSVGSPSSSGDFLTGRVRSFSLTWLRPSYDGGTGDVILVVMSAAVALAVLAARRHPGDNGPVTVLTIVAAAMAVLALVVVPATVIPDSSSPAPSSSPVWWPSGRRTSSPPAPPPPWPRAPSSPSPWPCSPPSTRPAARSSGAAGTSPSASPSSCPWACSPSAGWARAWPPPPAGWPPPASSSAPSACRSWPSVPSRRPAA